MLLLKTVQPDPINLCDIIVGVDSSTNHKILEVWVLRVLTFIHTSLSAIVLSNHTPQVNVATISARCIITGMLPKPFNPRLRPVKIPYALFGHFPPAKSIPNHQRVSNNGKDQSKGDDNVHLLKVFVISAHFILPSPNSSSDKQTVF